jgi:hypothetical protein
MRDPREIALELYSRGFTATRQEATDLVAENPDACTFLLNLPSIDREMRNHHDIASIDEWGHADTGQAP